MADYDWNWYSQLKTPDIQPPRWVFGVVWPILYTMMGIAAYIVWKDPSCRSFCDPLKLFGVQLFFNLIWTWLFFNQKKIGLALVDLLLTLAFAVYTTISFYRVNKLAGYLMIPYCVWLCFAAYLNAYIYVKNPQFR